jgi:hypothetical protein
MSNQKETKLNRLTVNKETIQDLDVPNAGKVKGGATVNEIQTQANRCDLVDKSANGVLCETLLARCVNP